jgi:hypothetical protein
MMFAKKVKDLLFEKNYKFYTKKLKEYINKIFENETFFNLFIKKMDYLFENFQKKFNFI